MRILLTGEVNTDMFEKFASTDFRGESAVEIILNSDGGTATAAVGIVEYMRLIKARHGTEFSVLAIGSCQSAATLILACGDVRKITKETIVMVHEDCAVEFSGKVHEAETYAAYLRSAENQWNRILASKTKVSAAEWSLINRQDTYLAPEQCLAMGLVDVIV